MTQAKLKGTFTKNMKLKLKVNTQWFRNVTVKFFSSLAELPFLSLFDLGISDDKY